MSEFDSRHEFEPSQQDLQSTWELMAKALVLHAETVAPYDNGHFDENNIEHVWLQETLPQPYVFRQELDKTKTRIATNETSMVTVATAEYYTPHHSDPDVATTQETVTLDWTTHDMGAEFAVNRSIVIVRENANGSEQYVGYGYDQVIEYMPEGERIRGYREPQPGQDFYNNQEQMDTPEDDSGRRSLTETDLDILRKITGIIAK